MELTEKMEENTDKSKSSENVSATDNKHISLSNWPTMMSNSPWEFADEDTEALYYEALYHYIGKLQNQRAEMQSELDTWIPKTGAYANSKSKYVKICYKSQDNNGIYALRFNQNTTLLVTGYENGLVEVTDMMSEVVIPVKEAGKSSAALSAIKFHPNDANHFYFSCTNGRVFTCRRESVDDEFIFNTQRIINEFPNETYAMDINMSGEKMITAGKDSRIRVYDLATNEISACYKGFVMECKDSYTRLLEEDEEEGHYLNIYSLVCHPENPFIFASGGMDSNIKIWDLRMKQFPVKNIYGPRILGDAIDLQGNQVLSAQWASRDGIQIWDASSCRLLQTFKPVNTCPQSFGQYFYCAKFMKGKNGFISDDIVLAGGAGLGGLLVLSLSENLIVSQFKDEESILALDNSENLLAYGGSSHIMYISQFIQNTLAYHSSTESTADLSTVEAQTISTDSAISEEVDNILI